MNREEEQTYRAGVIEKLDNINKDILKLDSKVSYTNGRVRRHEKLLWLAGGVMIASVLSGNQVVAHLIMSFI